MQPRVDRCDNTASNQWTFQTINKTKLSVFIYDPWYYGLAM